MAQRSGQQGFVSILTVLFFMTLISVVTVSFTRFMVQERQQELEDELTKSAYNAALAGIEDAKQAMAYCSGIGASDPACDANLYTTACPGFNTSPYFKNAIGIPQSSNGRTSITGENVTTAAQGYSCVILTKNTTSIEGSLDPLSASGAMFELRTIQPYQKVRIYWEPKTGVNGLAANFNTGNPRLSDWQGSWPAVLRTTLFSVPTTASFNLSQIDASQTSSFIYPIAPVGSGSATTMNVAAIAARTYAQCDITSNTSTYRCYVDIDYGSMQSDRRYIVMNALYKATDYQIVAYNGPTPTDVSKVSFNAVQPSIDSTGYTSGVSRRVVVRVHAGGQSINTSNAIDSGFALCKDFSVGYVPDAFLNRIEGRCGN